MTDKQIIDGVDVSGCIHFNKTTLKHFNCNLYNKCIQRCKGTNCYYKKWQRKEQECERLKGKNNYSPEVLKQCPHYKDNNICTYLGYESKCEGNCNYTAFQDFIAEIDDLKDVNNKLRQQLDQLKAENETYKKMLEDEEVILALNEVRTGERHLWFNKAEKYKQTLTEIREIVGIGLVDGLQPEEYSGFLKILQAQILQKISEVE